MADVVSRAYRSGVIRPLHPQGLLIFVKAQKDSESDGSPLGDSSEETGRTVEAVELVETAEGC